MLSVPCQKKARLRNREPKSAVRLGKVDAVASGLVQGVSVVGAAGFVIALLMTICLLWMGLWKKND